MDATADHRERIKQRQLNFSAQGAKAAVRSRRSHQKSRNGCRNCKLRKIKCDEVKPQCWPCTKHAIKCDYSRPQSASPDTRAASEDAAPPILSQSHSPIIASSNTAGVRRSNMPFLLNPSTPPATPPPPPASAGGGAKRSPEPSATPAADEVDEPATPLDMVDLELLHHFTIAVAPTLSTMPDLQMWWRIEVPRLALRHDFVMRALLAVSGVHLARTRASSARGRDQQQVDPDSGTNANFHIQRAVSQQRIALRAAILADVARQPVTEEDCAALYVFSVLTMIISMALPRNSTSSRASTTSSQPVSLPNAAEDAGDDTDLLLVNSSGAIADWLRLFRAIKAVADPDRHQWMVGDTIGATLAEIYRPAQYLREQHAQHLIQTAPLPEDYGVPKPLLRLRDALSQWRRPSGEPVVVQEEAHVVLAALQKLIQVFRTLAHRGPTHVLTLRAMFGWGCEVDDGYLKLLARREPQALFVVAGFGVLLHRVRKDDGGGERNWWIEGWGPRVVRAAVVGAGDHGKETEWLEWAVREVGLR